MKTFIMIVISALAGFVAYSFASSIHTGVPGNPGSIRNEINRRQQEQNKMNEEFKKKLSEHAQKREQMRTEFEQMRAEWEQAQQGQ